MQQEKKKQLFSVSNIITALLFLFAVSMFVFPEVKATVLQGLMKIGLFQPSVSSKSPDEKTARSWNVQFADSKGATIDGNSLKGKVVFVNVWATWCPPCIAEMPSISELYKKYHTNPDMVFLLVDADNDFAKSEHFMSKKGFNLPVHTSQTNIPSEWFESSLPTTIVLNKQGNIVFKETGAANYNSEKFINFIDGLLKN